MPWELWTFCPWRAWKLREPWPQPADPDKCHHNFEGLKRMCGELAFIIFIISSKYLLSSNCIHRYRNLGFTCMTPFHFHCPVSYGQPALLSQSGFVNFNYKNPGDGPFKLSWALVKDGLAMWWAGCSHDWPVVFPSMHCLGPPNNRWMQSTQAQQNAASCKRLRTTHDGHQPSSFLLSQIGRQSCLWSDDYNFPSPVKVRGPCLYNSADSASP